VIFSIVFIEDLQVIDQKKTVTKVGVKKLVVLVTFHTLPVVVPGLLHTSFYDSLGLFEHILTDFEISRFLHTNN